MVRKRNIAILATLDTKGEEVAAMKGSLAALNYAATIVDIGPLGPPAVQPDIPNSEVARLAGWELAALVRTGRRDRIMEEMGKGAARLLSLLCSEGRIAGVMGLGGNQGTAVAAAAMRVLPFGFPKYLVSTVASGDIRPYVGDRDIGIVFSVGDFLGGANPVTESILANAVAAVVGMAEHGREISVPAGEVTLAVTALGNTEPAAARAVKTLRANGFQVIPFHASGAGGSAMEGLIREGLIQGVLDLTPHELAEEVADAGIYRPIAPGRMTAAGEMAIPQVVSTGGMEYLCFGPRESIPLRLRQRKTYMHNPLNANVKLSRSEMAHVGAVMAERLNAARGPAAVLIPLKGWSVYGGPGGPLHDEGGNRQLVKALKEGLRKDIAVQEIDAHINDAAFVDACVRQLTVYLKQRSPAARGATTGPRPSQSPNKKKEYKKQ
jgi:uncharacterized protein (UPF0261 family)